MPRMSFPRRRARALIFFSAILVAAGLAVPGFWSVAGQTSLAGPSVLPGDAANGGAAGSQEQPQVAAGADAHLAVWMDVRTVLEEESRVGAVSIDNPIAGLGLGSLIDIYAARIDAAGRVIDTTPIIVSQAEFGQIYPRVAWNGQHWLVTWFTKRPRNQYSHAYDIVGARVSPAGEVLDPDPIVIATDLQHGHWPETVITDAAGNWVVVWTSFLPQEGTSIPRGVFVARVADGGTVLDPGGRLAYNHHSQYLSFPDLARAGDLYMLTFEGYVGSVQAAWAMPLDANFNPLRAGPERIGPGARPRVTSNGDTFFAIFNGQRGTRISRAGDPLDPDGIQISTASAQAAGQVTWDGANWFVSHNVGTPNGDDIAATRVSPDGQVLGTVTLDAGAGHQTYSGVAPVAGGGAQVVWHDTATGDINAARVSAAGVASGEVTVSLGAPRQSEARLASDGNGFLAVFRSETAGVFRVMGQHLDAEGSAIDREPFVIAEGGVTNNPSVAWNGSAYLAVWDVRTATGTKQTHARVVPSAGPPAAPAFFVMNGETPDVAALDGTFLVVNILQETSQIRTTRAVRVAGAGAVLGSPVNVDRFFNFAPRVAAFGGRWLAVWERHNNHDDSPGIILGSFVSPADGSITKPFIAGDTAGNDKSPHLAVAGDQALVAWHYGDTVGRSGDVNTRRLNADGTSPEPNAGTPLATAADVQAAASVAWDGNQYVVTWVDHRAATFPRHASGDVYAARVSPTNVRLEEFPVANSALPEGTPFVASANGLTIFSYAKFYPEAPFSAYRLTLRAARLAPPDAGPAPLAPSSLVAEQVNTGPGFGNVRLRWRDNSADETGFLVEAGTDGTSYSQIKQLPAGAAAAQDISVNPQAQNYFRVRAESAAGGSGYSNVASPPVASLVSPAAASAYNYPALVPLAAAASDPDGIARVEFYASLDPADGGAAGIPALIATVATPDAQGRYQFNWAAPAGYYHITAKAFDAQGSSTVAYETTVLVRRAPTATVTAPANNATFAEGAAVTLTASAATTNNRSDEFVERLDFYAGDVLVGQGASAAAQGPWSFTWQNAPAGTHSVTARATSNSGMVGVSAPVRLSVGSQPAPGTNPPAVRITSPPSGGSYALGTKVAFTAEAAAAAGRTVARVDFVWEPWGRVFCTDFNAPYTCTVSDSQTRLYDIVAVAYDSAGVAGKSAPARVVFEDTRKVSISGRLRHNASQPGNEIFLTNALVKLDMDSQPYRETRTDAQGNFRFDNLGWGGGFTLRPAEPGYAFYPPYVSWSGVIEDQVYDFIADGPVPPQPQPQPTPGANALAWEKFYDGPQGQGDGGGRLFVDAQGNSYVAGVTAGAAGGSDTDIVTVKYGPTGTLLWAKTFAATSGGTDQPADLRVDADGNVYVAGTAHRGAASWQDFVTIKYDAAGNEQWARYYNGSHGQTDTAHALELDADGNVFVTGSATSAEPATGYVFEEFATVKYDPAGAEQWVRLHSTKKYLQSHYGVDVAVDAAGNSYVTGYAVLDTGYDVVTVKYSPAGEVLWASRFDGGGASRAADVPVGVLLDPAGHVFVYGYNNAGQTQEDFLLVKLNGATGATLWSRTWAAPATDYVRDAAVDSAGNVVLTGETRDADYYAATRTATTDVATVKFDGAGNLLWERVYRAFPGKLDAGRRVALDASGAAYVGVYSEGFFNSDTAVIKYRADGTEAWVYRYDNPSHTTDQLSGLRADGAGNLYLAGSAVVQTAPGVESSDISLVKLAAATATSLNSPPDVSLSVAPAGETAQTSGPVMMMAAAYESAAVAGCSATLTAAAADRDGTVARVDFYNGEKLVGSDTAAPYSVSWTPAAGGTYAVNAMATDNTGATRTSATSAVTLTCGPAPTPTPTPAPTSYAVGGQVTAGGVALSGVTVTLSGTRSATATTGADGRYTFANLPAGANCTVTPSLQGYDFTPASKSFTAVSANQTADFTAAAARVNVALASNGATATASSTNSAGRAPLAAINGDRRGLHWGTDPATGSGWLDATANAFPDWLEVAFPAAKTISEVNVFSVQNNYTAPVEPTEAMTFTTYGVTAFDVQYWTGSAWATVPGGSITGNNKVWRKVTFAPLTTTRIRVLVKAGLSSHSRLTEVEAWTVPENNTSPVTPALVNHALASRGATAAASSVRDAGRAPLAAINGDRRGLHWGTDPATGSGWLDATQNAFPDWLEVSFAGARQVSEVHVFSVQDNYTSPVEPTEAMTFATYGVTGFQVEYWTGSAWQVVPGGLVVSNNKVWAKLSFAPLTTSKIRVVVNGGQSSHSRLVEVEAWGPADTAASPRVNVAAAANGATATASSVLDAGRSALAAVNGDRRGIHWGTDAATGSGWHDSTNNLYPDWLAVTFSGAKTISEINVFSVQDAVTAPAEPTEVMAFTKYGVTTFDLEYWTGTAWQIVPGGMVTGNNKVWRKLTFAPLTTTKIRVVVKGALAGHSRLAEVEVY